VGVAEIGRFGIWTDLSRLSGTLPSSGGGRAEKFGSHDELLADEVEVVYVGTIHVTHHATVLKVLEAGKPVLCEKPMTMSPAHTSELISAARARKLFLMEAVWMRFFPAVAEMRRMISQDFIGEVRFVRANFSFRCPPTRAKGRLTDPELGGGAVLELGVYTISLATMVFGGERPR
jgi:dihydrodiol dehydrogenase / D-xylose 1-dehydrogenase (NADP)